MVPGTYFGQLLGRERVTVFQTFISKCSIKYNPYNYSTATWTTVVQAMSICRQKLSFSGAGTQSCWLNWNLTAGSCKHTLAPSPRLPAFFLLLPQNPPAFHQSKLWVYRTEIMADSRLSYSEPPLWVSLDCPSRGAPRQPEGTICCLCRWWTWEHSPRCSAKAVLRLCMTILPVGALRMPSVSHSAAKEAVDTPGLKSARLLCKQGWEHCSPFPSCHLGQSPYRPCCSSKQRHQYQGNSQQQFILQV